MLGHPLPAFTWLIQLNFQSLYSLGDPSSQPFSEWANLLQAKENINTSQLFSSVPFSPCSSPRQSCAPAHPPLLLIQQVFHCSLVQKHHFSTTSWGDGWYLDVSTAPDSLKRQKSLSADLCVRTYRNIFKRRFYFSFQPLYVFIAMTTEKQGLIRSAELICTMKVYFTGWFVPHQFVF